MNIIENLAKDVQLSWGTLAKAIDGNFEELSKQKIGTDELPNLLTKSEATLTYLPKGDYATKEELISKADTTEIPTKVSQLENDNGYITSIPSEYITNEELERKEYVTTTQLNLSISDKLNKAEADIYYQPIGDYALKSEIPDTSKFATKLEVELVSNIKNLDGVIDYSLENLFKKEEIQTYDSPFADKVFEAIGRKTDSTGCYSNPIPCKIGDWFTRNDFGTGIVVVLDSEGNILGDIKNAAYQPTIQIKESEGLDFTNIVSVVFVVMLASIETEKIVKAKYVPEDLKEEENTNIIEIPNLRINPINLSLDVAYIKSINGNYYELVIDDTSPSDVLIKVRLISDFIPEGNLPSDFPFFDFTNEFKDFENLVLGGKGYIFILNNKGVVKYKALLNVIGNYCIKPLMNSKGERRFGVVTDEKRLTGGNSEGKLVIYDENLEEIDNVIFTDGNKPECHDFYYIDDRHYIIHCYLESTSYNDGTGDYNILPLRVEEQKDGKRLWVWNSTDYKDLHLDSHVKNGDYLHDNTITLDYDGNLLLNFKQANEAVKIKRTYNFENDTCEIGEILYKIGGNSGSSYPDYDNPIRIKFEDNGSHQWYEPHDLLYCGMTNIEGVDYPTYTIFNNRSGSYSEVLEFSIDYLNKIIKSFNAYRVDNYFGRYLGGVLKIGEKRYLICWGNKSSQPMFGIYDFNDGLKKVWECSFRTNFPIYRVYGYNSDTYQDGVVKPVVEIKNVITDKLDISFIEGNSAVVLVKLNKAPNDDSININVKVNNENCSISPETLTFTLDNFSTYLTITISAENTSSDSSRSSIITFTDSTNEYLEAKVNVTVNGSFIEIESEASFSTNTLLVNEGESVTNKLSVTLDLQPTKEHTLTFTAENDYITLQTNNLIFNKENWNLPQYVLFTVKSDTENYEDHTCKIIMHNNITSTDKECLVTIKNTTENGEVIMWLDSSDHGEEEGIWKDKSGNGNDLILNGFDSYNWDEKGLLFNGTSTYGICESFKPFAELESIKDFEMLARISVTGLDSDTLIDTIIQTAVEKNPYAGINIDMMSSARLRYSVNIINPVRTGNQGISSRFGHNLLIKIVYEDSTISALIKDETEDKVLTEINREPCTVDKTSTLRFIIGALDNLGTINSRFFNGYIKEFKFTWLK